jgi:hypothetical protein
MGFLVAHFRKVKTTAGLGAVTVHNSRANVYENDQLKPNPPAWLVNSTEVKHNESQVLNQRAEVIAAAALKKKPYKNAAVAVEAVFLVCSDKRDHAVWKADFRDCRDWVAEKFGKENVLRWDEHFDEKTPHMHVLMVPIIRDQKLGNKYSSGDFLGGRQGLRDIQTELAEKVGRKYGLERGREGTNVRHTNQVAWAAKLAEKAIKLDEQKNKIKEFQDEFKTLMGIKPSDVCDLETKLANWDNQTPDSLRQFARQVEVKGFRTVGEYRQAQEAKREREQQQKHSLSR